MSDDEVFERAEALIDQCKPLFAGQEPYVVGAALADLVAIWIASHFFGDAAQTAAMHERLMKHHMRFVRVYLPPEIEHAKEILRAMGQ